jgi:ATP-dependent RNA helicase DeaD
VIGSIQIADRFSLVEVPEASADAIIEVLRTTTIKGKKVPVRRDRDGA